VFTNANTTPFPLVVPGARHRLKTIRLDTGLIKGFNLVSSTVTGALNPYFAWILRTRPK
jgi:hypothetical protein